MDAISVTVDLRAELGAARDQGRRPTCLAFAISDAHAHSRTQRDDLSVEYAFYHGIRRGGTDPRRGVSLSVMVEVLRQDGQPAEEYWPYLSMLPSPLENWKPPVIPGEIFRRSFHREEADFDAICAFLQQRRAVVLTLMITAQLHLPPKNLIVRPTPNDPDVAPHALLVVGCGKTRDEKILLVRNSWGKGWADAGHIWLAENYVRRQQRWMAVAGERN